MCAMQAIAYRLHQHYLARQIEPHHLELLLDRGFNTRGCCRIDRRWGSNRQTRLPLRENRESF